MNAITKEVDYIIVGQGIVGTLVSYFFLQQNQSILVVDKMLPGAASMHSSGIINPITGRRFVKSWQVDTLLPFAKQTYVNLQELLQVKLFAPIEICKIINSTREENDLFVDMGSFEYQPYFPKQEKTFLDESKFTTPFGSYLVHEGIKLDTPLLISEYNAFLANANLLQDEIFDYNALNQAQSMYKNIAFKKIIFCQGFANIHNPFFKNILIEPNKGEYIIVKTKEAHNLSYTLTANGIITPLSSTLLYVGATYQWVGEDCSITDDATIHLKKVLQQICKLEYEIISQGVGLRPSIQSRKPIAGLHPSFSNLAILNGMGTKGTLLAPYYANQLVQHILSNSQLDSEVALKK